MVISYFKEVFMRYKAERIITQYSREFEYFKEMYLLGYDNIEFNEKEQILIISFYKEVN